MNGRKQKTEKDTCQREDRAELEVNVEGQTFLWMTEKGDTNTKPQEPELLEFILSPKNLNEAYKKVMRNKGSGGVDRMQTDEIVDYLREHKDELLTQLLDGKYKPQPVLRVEIPKENGKKRSLGIPVVVDRVVQQAITQQLTPIYERQLRVPTRTERPSGRNAMSGKCKRGLLLCCRHGFGKVL